jgi:hypothetical protein
MMEQQAGGNSWTKLFPKSMHCPYILAVNRKVYGTLKAAHKLSQEGLNDDNSSRRLVTALM